MPLDHTHGDGMVDVVVIGGTTRTQPFLDHKARGEHKKGGVCVWMVEVVGCEVVWGFRQIATFLRRRMSLT